MCYRPDHFVNEETQDILSNLYRGTQPKIARPGLQFQQLPDSSVLTILLQ